MTDLLRAVRDHAAMRRAVIADELQATVDAYEGMIAKGEREVVPRIAEAAGVSRQAIYQRLRRNVDRSDNRGSFREEREG